MPRALNLFRDLPYYRKQCFSEGLAAAGFKVVDALSDPQPDDVLLIWNRYGTRHEVAKRFERAGAAVFVAENAYLPESLIGKGWYALARGHHAGAGRCPNGDAARWARFGVALEPWRSGGTEVVLLGQRGIGEPGVASPRGWDDTIRRKVGGRIRPHPGKYEPRVPLERDIADARCVVTWASSSALMALLWGIPVFHGFDRWIGAGAARPVGEFWREPRCDDDARLSVFHRVAAAQWHLDEIRRGEAFRCLAGI